MVMPGEKTTPRLTRKFSAAIAGMKYKCEITVKFERGLGLVFPRKRLGLFHSESRGFGEVSECSDFSREIHGLLRGKFITREARAVLCEKFASWENRLAKLSTHNPGVRPTGTVGLYDCVESTAYRLHAAFANIAGMAETPMMRQYQDAKAACPEALLLFRMGDFYELFFDDARTAARLLGLALTSRDKSENAVPMAGFPHHQLESYLAKLVSLGMRVAICEQVENPKEAKGLVKREVTRVVTPGTLTDDALLDPRECNYLAAVVIPMLGKPAVAPDKHQPHLLTLYPLAVQNGKQARTTKPRSASRGLNCPSAAFTRRSFQNRNWPINWRALDRQNVWWKSKSSCRLPTLAKGRGAAASGCSLAGRPGHFHCRRRRKR